MRFKDLLKKYRKEAFSEREKGTDLNVSWRPIFKQIPNIPTNSNPYGYGMNFTEGLI